jgi:Pyridoxamine 5'-phosphate oxidase
MGFRLTDAEAWEFVAHAHTGILTTVRRDGRAISLPVWHVVLDSHVYVRAPASTAKLVRIRNDPRVSFLVEEGQAWAELKAVRFDALAMLETRPDVIEAVLERLAEKYGAFGPPLERLPPAIGTLYSDRTVIRLDPQGRLNNWNNAGLLAP